MIRITVELIPFGFGKPQHLGTCKISNDGTGTPTVGHYRVRLSKRGRPASTWRTGTVRDFPRRRLGVWDLMYRALREIVADRNEKEAA